MSENEKLSALIETGDEGDIKCGIAVMLITTIMAVSAAAAMVTGVVLANLLT